MMSELYQVFSWLSAPLFLFRYFWDPFSNQRLDVYPYLSDRRAYVETNAHYDRTAPGVSPCKRLADG
jgi:hypothetical protein